MLIYIHKLWKMVIEIYSYNLHIDIFILLLKKRAYIKLSHMVMPRVKTSTSLSRGSINIIEVKIA